MLVGKGVFPAHAGMIRSVTDCRVTAFGVPRACGDDPAPVSGSIVVPACSPRMRG